MRKTGAVAHFIVFSRPHQSYRGCQPAGFSSFTAFCFFPSILGSSGRVSPTYSDVCRIINILTLIRKYYTIHEIFGQHSYDSRFICFASHPVCSAWHAPFTSCVIFLLHITPPPLSTWFLPFFFFFLLCKFPFFVLFVFCLRMHLEITQVCVVSVCQEEHLLSMLAMLLLNWNIWFLL